MSTATSCPTEEIYVDGTTACVMLRTHSRKLARLVEAGSIESFQLPGSRRKYSLASLKRLVEQSRGGVVQRAS